MSFTFKNSVNKPVTARLETDRYINDNLAILVFETKPEEYDDGYYCNLTNPRSQGCPRFQSGEELANNVGKINAHYSL